MPIDYQSNVVSNILNVFQFTDEATCLKFCQDMGGQYSINYIGHSYSAWICGSAECDVSWLLLNSHMRTKL